MEYTSTRNSALRCSSAQAIVTGIAPDGGLFVPTEFPTLDVRELVGLTYPQTAVKVLSCYLTDYDISFLEQSAEKVYSDANFGGKAGFVARPEENSCLLELWHGPTCAFKDYALQMMPKLLVEGKKIIGDSSMTKILVATSGDTGKAALAGYAGLEGIRIAVFYPNDGTSEVQRLQMVTQDGDNVSVYAVEGNFDDAQTGVKRAFTDESLRSALAEKGEKLSSANSINWGRLVPQIVYYFYSYASLLGSGAIREGEKIDFCVPTGNFGDILAGYYAMRMGLPVGRLICASNCNDVLTEFLSTGVYNARRPFHKTTSPSMDILVSSNLERLLYHVTDDSERVRGWMKELNETGTYTVDKQTLAAIQAVFGCGSASDAQAAQAIQELFSRTHYLMDPHTAVAWHVARGTAKKGALCVILSTADPYKFPCSVLAALGKEVPEDEFEAMRELSRATDTKAPDALAGLRDRSVRFTETIDPVCISDVALNL